MDPRVLKADKDGRPTVVVYKRTVADREAARAERLERVQRAAEIRESLRAQRHARRRAAGASEAEPDFSRADDSERGRGWRGRRAGK